MYQHLYCSFIVLFSIKCESDKTDLSRIVLEEKKKNAGKKSPLSSDELIANCVVFTCGLVLLLSELLIFDFALCTLMSIILLILHCLFCWKYNIRSNEVFYARLVIFFKIFQTDAYNKVCRWFIPINYLNECNVLIILWYFSVHRAIKVCLRT